MQGDFTKGTRRSFTLPSHKWDQCSNKTALISLTDHPDGAPEKEAYYYCSMCVCHCINHTHRDIHYLLQIRLDGCCFFFFTCEPWFVPFSSWTVVLQFLAFQYAWKFLNSCCCLMNMMLKMFHVTTRYTCSIL